MIPFILAGIGAYLVGSGLMKKSTKSYKDGGEVEEKFSFFGTSESGWYAKDKSKNKWIRPTNKMVWESKKEAIEDVKDKKFKYSDDSKMMHGGMMAKGGFVAVGEKHGYWTIMSKPTTKEKAQKVIDMGVPKGEVGKVVTLEQAKSHKKVIGEEYLAEGGKMADGGDTKGKNGYVAFYKGKRIEVYADTMYEAQLKAAKIFNAKKSYDVNVVLAEVGGEQYVNSTMASGGKMAKGGKLEIGDMVMVDDSGYVKLFSGFDITKPAKIISKGKTKSSGKVVYFYGLEMADGRKPFNNAPEYKLTKVSEDGGKMARGGNVRSLLKNFNEEKPTIALIMIADDVSSDFMKAKFDRTIKWSELTDAEKQKYNEDFRVNKSKFETYLMYEFVKLYYSDDKIKEKCKGSSRKTIDAIKSVMTDLAKKYDESKYEDGGYMAKGGEVESKNVSDLIKEGAEKGSKKVKVVFNPAYNHNEHSKLSDDLKKSLKKSKVEFFDIVDESVDIVDLIKNKEKKDVKSISWVLTKK